MSVHTKGMFTDFTDPELYAYCQRWGSLSLEARRKFAGALPEVCRRGLHRRRGYASIHEFAARLAGMSENNVDKILSLARRLERLPHLKSKFEKGEVGWSKINLVVAHAEPSTDHFWAEKVQSLSQLALKNFVASLVVDNQLKNKIKWSQMSFPLSPVVERRFRQFKRDLERKKSKTLTFNEVIENLLGRVGGEKVVVQVCPNCVDKGKGRYIPKDVKRLVRAIHGASCAFPGCRKASDSLHHTKRWFLNQEHDPKHIVPLCRGHENLVHAGLIENEDEAPAEWRVLKEPDKNHPKYLVDQMVQQYRKM